MIKLHILNTSGSLDSIESILRVEFDKSIKEIQAKIPVDDVDVVVCSSSFGTSKEIIFGPHTLTKNVINISIFPNHDKEKKFIIKDFKNTLAHELYHTVRDYTYENENHYLLYSLINEGLAEHFALEVFKSPPNPWTVALSDKDLNKYLKMAEKEFNSKNYDYYEWFFGTKDIPVSTGYSLGYYLVKKYFEKNPDQLPSTVIELKPEDFLV